VLAIIWAIIQAYAVAGIKIENDAPVNDEMTEMLEQTKTDALVKIGTKISEGANAFLYAEYKIMSVFIAVFGIIIYFLVDYYGAVKNTNVAWYPFATITFVIGAVTSILCGFIGMKIAVMANFRTTYKAIYSLEEAFGTAYRAGCVMGFGMVGISLIILVTIMLIYISIYQPLVIKDEARNNFKTYDVLMELIAGYGLGGSSMALFGRVGGGIYTKAADVGADLVGKVEQKLQEDDIRNPATIADNVGDNVGDIAGMGSDLFGSFAEATCAALCLIASDNSMFNEDHRQVIWYPLVISAMGIFACLITSIIGIFVYKVTKIEKIQFALNLQLGISTFLVLVGLWAISPSMFNSNGWEQKFEGIKLPRKRYWYHPAICTSLGLVSGFLIGISTDYYTSASWFPVREMAQKCTSGAAINVIYGLAVGYLSTIIPIILLSITVIVNIYLMDMLGVALGAIGMLSTLCVGLAIDAYGPISDNAGGIAEMAGLDDKVRE